MHVHHAATDGLTVLVLYATSRFSWRISRFSPLTSRYYDGTSRYSVPQPVLRTGQCRLTFTTDCILSIFDVNEKDF